MKRFIPIFMIFCLAVTISGCIGQATPNPESLAQADAIRAQIAQDSADRAAARNAQPVIVQQSDPIPWYMLACLFGALGMAASILAGFALGWRSHRDEERRELPPIQPRPVIMGARGVYLVVQPETGASRMLDLSNPADVKLLQEARSG